MKNGCLNSLLGAAAVVAMVVGIVFYFLGYETVTIVCAVITLIDSAYRVFFGDQHNFKTEAIAAIIGLIVALIFHLNILPCIAVALCIEATAAFVIGWAMVIVVAIFNK